jgi:serine/threonine-protein kinase
LQHTQFGRYVIVSELGRGAMGAVHRAVDPLLERDVAIKTLLPSLPTEIIWAKCASGSCAKRARPAA